MDKTITEIMDGNGNAFAIMGRVALALQEKGINQQTIADYETQAKSGDYDNLRQVSIQTLERAGYKNET